MPVAMGAHKSRSIHSAHRWPPEICFCGSLGHTPMASQPMGGFVSTFELKYAGAKFRAGPFPWSRPSSASWPARSGTAKAHFQAPEAPAPRRRHGSTGAGRACVACLALGSLAFRLSAPLARHWHTAAHAGGTVHRDSAGVGVRPATRQPPLLCALAVAPPRRPDRPNTGPGRPARASG